MSRAGPWQPVWSGRIRDRTDKTERGSSASSPARSTSCYELTGSELSESMAVDEDPSWDDEDPESGTAP